MTPAPKHSQAALEAALAPHGLCLRGAWQPRAQDALPALPGGRDAGVVWMVGQLGTQSWAPFRASRFFSDGLPDPVDRWSQSIGDALAREFGGLALYPFGGPPWHPFQQWATRAEGLQSSPLMLLMHPQYGLWHAYRFALALPEIDEDQEVSSGDATANAAPLEKAGDRPALAALSSLCASCDGQPCLQACPVDAFTGKAYQVDRCASHLHSAQGEPCMSQGCLARRICPVGVEHRYGQEQAAFHMAAFASRH